MIKKILPPLVASLFVLPVLSETPAAHADRVVVKVGGSARIKVRTPRVRARARVRVRTPRVRTRTRYRRHYKRYHRPRVRVRVGGYWGMGYSYRYASPPPRYYSNNCYYDYGYDCGYVGSYRTYPQAYSNPVPVATVAPRPMLPRFGIGLFAGSMTVENQDPASDIGVLARFRLTPALSLEGEIAKSEIADGNREERRMGASLIYDFSPYSKFSLFGLAGGGASENRINGVADTAAQGYAELGLGLRWRVSPRLELTGDVRAGARETEEGAAVFQTSTVQPIEETEGFTRGRLSAILYF